MEAGRILIDTSVLIDYYRKKNIKNTQLFRLSEKFDICLSIITEFEFLIGFTDEKLVFAKEMINEMDIIGIDQLISEEARRIYLNLKKINKLVPFPDLFIAATASIKNIPLATLNKKHFEFIEGIKLL